MNNSHLNRAIYLIEGNFSDCLINAQQLTKNLQTLLLDDPRKANDFLGQEFDAVIFNATDTFDVNALGAISGTIRSGGYLLLLRPQACPESLFLKRFNTFLQKYNNVDFIESKQTNLQALNPPKRKEYIAQYATEDQQQAVEAVMRVVKGHRRRPLVITSDRGRGKSSALGIAAAKLYNDGLNNIIVCAPSKKTATAIFRHATTINADINLKFYAPDELYRQQPEADLVLVDEAAAIPVPLLTSFVKRYSRIVFSSTQHGYEGSGRGFTIRFQKELDQLAPEWKSIYLNTPVRWKENDTLEQFIFETLLLNAEAVDKEKIEAVGVADCRFVRIKKAQLINNESLLGEIFGLLVNAHYQTKPSDLRQLLDEEAISIFTLQANSSVVAVAVTIHEGGIDEQTCTDIFAGKRRLKGHLVAQSLAANVGIAHAPILEGERVIRIAIHPSLQRQGLGSYLLKSLADNCEADYLGTSFGATDALIRFWKKANFTSVYLGIKRDASSGAHSIIMLQAITKKGHSLVTDAKTRFNIQFPYLLPDPFNQLEDDIVLALLDNQSEMISENENQLLQAFAYQQRGYENTLYPIWKLVCNKLADNVSLDKKENKILILKVLQKTSWLELTGKMSPDISGKKAGLSLMRQAVSKLLGSTD